MGTVIGGGLRSFLHRQAREQAMNVLAEAQDMAAAITAEAERQSATEKREIAMGYDEAIATTHHRALTQARLTARLSLVREQGRVADQIWERATQVLREMPFDQRRESLRLLLLDAMSQLGEGDLAVTCAEQDRELLQTLLIEMSDELSSHGSRQVVLATESAQIWGGIRVSCVGTNRMIDNSWDQRLNLVESTRRDEIFHMLS